MHGENWSVLEKAGDYRDVNKKIRIKMKIAEEKWKTNIKAEIEENLKENTNKKAFQIVKYLSK